MPKRKHTKPAVEVDGAAANKEAAQQLPAGTAEAVVAVEETLDPAGGGGERAIKKARGEEPDVIPGSPMPPPAEGQSECNNEGALCIDALAAVCEWVESTADLVRLSCVSCTWRQLVARDGLWRRRFIAERGRPAHDAFALALDLHGHAVLASFLGRDRRPPALPVLSALDDDDDGGGEIKIAGVGVEETEEGGHGLGVWFEVLVSTGATQPLSSSCGRDMLSDLTHSPSREPQDKAMWWRRWLAALQRLEPEQGMHWMAKQVRSAKHRAYLEQGVSEWLDVGAVTGNEGARAGAGDGEQAYDRETDTLKAPTMKNELQKKQVRALLHMTRIIDHLENYCYGGACVLVASLLLAQRPVSQSLCLTDASPSRRQRLSDGEARVGAVPEQGLPLQHHLQRHVMPLTLSLSLIHVYVSVHADQRAIHCSCGETHRGGSIQRGDVPGVLC
jgi:hypothetical protein